MTLALGIDVGTSGVRCAVIDAAGAPVAMAKAAMAEAGPDRRAPAVWRGALALALDRLWTQVAPAQIGACAIDATSGTVLALNSAGQPSGGALMYNDPVEASEIVDAIASAAPRDSAAHGANSALARACVLRARPGVARILHQADWIAEQIAGAPVPSDESNALKTGYDPVARCWPSWLAETPIRPGLLPPVVPAGTQTGTTSGAFGLPAGIPTIAGVTDGCASFLATGADTPGDGVTALGTTLTIKLLSDRPIFAPEYGIYSHRIGDIWLAGGASNTGGGVLAQFFDPDALAALSAQIDPAAETTLDYYPLPKPGERFPINDPDLVPRLTPRPGDDRAFLHGLLDGIARIEALGYQRLAELGAPALRSVRTVGGGARNNAWTEIRRRRLGVPMAAADAEAAACGVARLALAHIRGAP